MARAGLIFLRWKIKARVWLESGHLAWVASGLWPLAVLVPDYLVKSGHHPPVGTYIAILGVLAAAVTLRKDPSLPEKAAWVLLFALIGVAEIRNLYISDDEEAGKFKETSEGLTRTADGLDKTVNALTAFVQLSQDQFQTTIANVNGVQKTTQSIAALSQHNLQTLTGGDTFLYVDFYPTFGDAGKIIKVGDDPLYGVKVRVGTLYKMRTTDLNGKAFVAGATSDYRDVELGDYSAGPLLGKDFLAIYNLPPNRAAFHHDEEPLRIAVTFSARNGSWREFVWIHHVENDGMNAGYGGQAIRVFRTENGKSKLIFEEIPKYFPRDLMTDTPYEKAK